jgi:hypothetical protein
MTKENQSTPLPEEAARIARYFLQCQCNYGFCACGVELLRHELKSAIIRLVEAHTRATPPQEAAAEVEGANFAEAYKLWQVFKIERNDMTAREADAFASIVAAALTQAEQRSREEAKAKVEGAMCDECFARGEAVDWHPVCVTVFSILSKLSTPQTTKAKE